MSQTQRNLSRRSFLGTGGALLAASSIPILATSAAQASAPLMQEGVSVSLIADALREMGQDAMKLSMTTDIKPVVNLGRTIIGPAVTTKWEIGRSRSSAEDIRRYVFTPLDEATSGSVWVVASGTDRILSMFGDVVAQACHRKGMVGAVTDSGCRDIAGMTKIGFPAFAKASVLYGPGNFIRPVGANVPVICGGTEVRPGDLVAADADGVIVIPSELITDLTTTVASLLIMEQEMRRKLDAGESLVKSHSL